MAVCPACGMKNDDAANFCIACGVDLKSTATEEKLRTDSAVAPTASTPPMTSPSVEMPPGYLDAPPPPVPPPAPPEVPAPLETPAPPEVPPSYLDPGPSPLADLPASAPAYTPYVPPVSGATPAYTPARPAKDRVIALVLEILLGVFGFLGIGWLYAGNTTAGVLWLVGGLLGTCLAVTLDFITFGFFVCIHVPVALGSVALSAYFLHSYTRQHPELFGV